MIVMPFMPLAASPLLLLPMAFAMLILMSAALVWYGNQ
jgi:hypothetical protein